MLAGRDFTFMNENPYGPETEKNGNSNYYQINQAVVYPVW